MVIKHLKRGYDAITKEHLVIFLVLLTAIILFNSFDFGYTGLTTREQCTFDGYSCCDKGYGEGIHYNYLDDSCLKEQGCYDSCGGNSVTGGTFWNDFLDLFKRDVRGYVNPSSTAQQILDDANIPGQIVVGDNFNLPGDPSGIFSWETSPTNVCIINSGMGSFEPVLAASNSGSCTLRITKTDNGQYDSAEKQITIISGSGASKAAQNAQAAQTCAQQKGLLPLPLDRTGKGTGSFLDSQLQSLDVDGNKIIDEPDFTAFCEAFGTVNSKYDLDNSGGLVSAVDYQIFIYAWGKTYGDGGNTGGNAVTYSCLGSAPGSTVAS